MIISTLQVVYYIHVYVFFFQFKYIHVLSLDRPNGLYIYEPTIQTNINTASTHIYALLVII